LASLSTTESYKFIRRCSMSSFMTEPWPPPRRLPVFGCL
jgi:hypothetical protein